MRNIARILLHLIVCISAMPSIAAAQGLPPAHEREAVVRVVTRWDGGCDATNRRRWDNMIDGWYEDITDDKHGVRVWRRDGFYENGNIVDSDFTDSDIVTWGNDAGDDNLDEADAVMVGLHGYISNDRWTAVVRVDEPGGGNCNAWQGHMQFGDEDLEFLHLSSCFSLNSNTWPNNWWDSFKGLHQVNGFHGIMYVTSTYDHRYEGFSDDAFDIAIASSWLDNLYKYRRRGKNQCPVALAVGSGRQDTWDRMDNEQYNVVYPDPNDPTGMAAVWIAGCDPRDASALP